MSINFSANQYEKNFHPIALQNWQVPKELGKRPHTREGSTQIIANERGHMGPGVARSRTSPWGTYVGTWDMPTPMPGTRMMNTTARSTKAIEQLQRCKTEGDIVLRGALKQCHLPDPLPVKADAEADVDVVHGANAGKPGTPMVYPTGQLPEFPPVSPPVQPIDDIPNCVSGIRSGAKNPSPYSPLRGKSSTIIHWPCPADPPQRYSGMKDELSHESIPQMSDMAVMPGSPVLAGTMVSPCRQPSPTQQITPIIGNEPELANLSHSPHVEWPMPNLKSKSK